MSGHARRRSKRGPRRSGGPPSITSSMHRLWTRRHSGLGWLPLKQTCIYFGSQIVDTVNVSLDNKASVCGLEKDRVCSC